MKKFLAVLATLAVGICAVPSFAMIEPRDMAPDYNDRVALTYGTKDLTSASGGRITTTAGSAVSGSAAEDIWEYVMPFSGSIMGIGVNATAALTKGYATFDVTINGVKQNQPVQIIENAASGGSQYAFKNMVDRFSKESVLGRAPFVAGDRIGVDMACGTTGRNGAGGPAVAPTSDDVIVTVIVGQQEVQ